MSKIIRMETLCLSRLHEPERQWITARQRIVKADCAIVVVHTDDGLTGIGEASAYGWPLRIREWVDWLAPARWEEPPTSAPVPGGRDPLPRSCPSPQAGAARPGCLRPSDAWCRRPPGRRAWASPCLRPRKRCPQSGLHRRRRPAQAWPGAARCRVPRSPNGS